MTDSIIFDVDGTLWDSTDLLAGAYNDVLIHRPDVAFRATGDKLKKVFGKPIDGIARAIFPELDEKDQLELIAQCIARENEVLETESGEIYPHVQDVIKSLSREYRIFIVSNCDKGYIEAFIRSAGLEAYVEDHLCQGDTGNYKDENIRQIIREHGLKTPVYVGDTQGDADSSASAGVPFIYVTYGFGRVDAYAACINSMDQLPDLLKGRDFYE